MRIDPSVTPMPAIYQFLISAVVPRPIAFVSTRGADGSTNLAPFSFFTALSSQPPMLGIAIVDRGEDVKDTLRNIRETHEFVVNVVNEPLLQAMVRTSGEWPASTSEFDVAHLTPASSERVMAPYVKESPLQLECRLHREIPIGSSTFIVGEIVLARASDDVLHDGRVDPRKLAPVGRLGGELYSLLREVRSVPRPRVSRTSGEAEG